MILNLNSILLNEFFLSIYYDSHWKTEILFTTHLNDIDYMDF